MCWESVLGNDVKHEAFVVVGSYLYVCGWYIIQTTCILISHLLFVADFSLLLLTPTVLASFSLFLKLALSLSRSPALSLSQGFGSIEYRFEAE